MSSALRACSAELLGTALLVVGGVGTAVIAGDTIGDLGVALAFGLSLLALAFALGPVSGAHLNPAVTLGALLTGRIRAGLAAGYATAQLVGGIIGAALVTALASSRPGFDLAADGVGANGYGAASTGGYGLPAALGVEVVLTFALVLVVLTATHPVTGTALAGIPIGIVLVVAHLVAIPVDGTSVNPARSLGPALFTGGTALSQLWVFLLAPLAGAVLAALAHRGLAGRDVPAPAAPRADSAEPAAI